MSRLEFSLETVPSEAERENGRLLFAGPSHFLKGVVSMETMPPADRLEVCFAGRSNVGKSTLLNALTMRKALSRTSNTPGRTQEINFFTLGQAYYLVDLPGYGYANAPLDIVAKWQRLLKSYLAGRASLRRVFLLIDARHGPKAVDSEIMDLLDRAAVAFQVVLTKSDKINDAAFNLNLAKTYSVLGDHPTAFPKIISTSSAKNRGLDILRSTIASIE